MLSLLSFIGRLFSWAAYGDCGWLMMFANYEKSGSSLFKASIPLEGLKKTMSNLSNSVGAVFS
jgi:hypothetical protein